MLLTGYFDETNISPNQPVPMVAGFLASEFQWKRFGEQWNKLLRQSGIPVHPKWGIRLVHRIELHRLQGVCRGWTPDRRDEFIIKAGAIIRRHTKMPIGNAVVRTHFEKIVAPRLQQTIGGCYGWCAYSCFHSVKQFCDKYDYKGPVNYVFEAGAPGQRQIMQLLEHFQKEQQLQEYFRVGNISFARKDVRQLQAADFLAYDLGKFALDYQLRRTRVPVVNYLYELLRIVRFAFGMKTR